MSLTKILEDIEKEKAQHVFERRCLHEIADIMKMLIAAKKIKRAFGKKIELSVNSLMTEICIYFAEPVNVVSFGIVVRNDIAQLVMTFSYGDEFSKEERLEFVRELAAAVPTIYYDNVHATWNAEHATEVLKVWREIYDRHMKKHKDKINDAAIKETKAQIKALKRKLKELNYDGADAD